VRPGVALGGVRGELLKARQALSRQVAAPWFLRLALGVPTARWPCHYSRREPALPRLVLILDPLDAS